MKWSSNPRMNCDGLAPYYELLERLSFGTSLERCRYAFLEHAQQSHSALLCGDGDGRFLASLLSCNGQVEVDYLDSSAEMLKLAQRRVVSLGNTFRNRVQFHHADIREFETRQSTYDLIATHFFLDCFDDAELPGLVRRLASWATPQAQWLVSDFRVADGTLARMWTGMVLRSLYGAFRVATGLQVARMPDYRGALTGAGFEPRMEMNSLAGLLHASLWNRV